jgi:PKD repeat protein
MFVIAARGSIVLVVALLTGLVPGLNLAAKAQTPGVSIVSPDNGEILDGIHTLQANINGTTATSVAFYYDAHEDDVPEVSIGTVTSADPATSFVLDWDTRTVEDTYNVIDTNGDDVEDTKVNITKPPTHDQLRVVATTAGGDLGAGIDVRIQNMATVRFTLPDNQEDIRGLQDLEAIVTSSAEVTSVRFDLYEMADADPRIITPFGEFQSLGEPIENAHYGRPLGAPAFPVGSPTHAIGVAVPEGTKRWVLRGWDTTTIADGTWLLVATAEDADGRRATYMVETYIVNDLRVRVTAPRDGATVSRFVALEARTSSLTGADNAAPGSLWPATAVTFTAGGTAIPGVETPEGSGRWRAVWNADAVAPGSYPITATAVNENPAGPENATHTINVNVVAPGGTLEAFFPFDWSNCTLQACSFLDGSGGSPTSWQWNFGDGNTSTAQNPTHTYGTHGVYTVSLTVSNDGGTTTSTYSRVIPVGNTGAVSFNRNDLDDAGSGTIDWTSAFKNFDYEVGGTLAIPVMWETSVGSAAFAALPTTVCDDDEDSSNQECVIFTPEEASGTPPTVVGAAEDGVLFTMSFDQVQFRGTTDVFKGKANIRVVTDVDLDGNGSIDQQNQLGTNIDVTNSGVEGEETRLVRIFAPAENQFVGGRNVLVRASTVSSNTPDQVEFFVNGSSIGVDEEPGGGWNVTWDTTVHPDTNPNNDATKYQLTAVASFGDTTTTSAVRLVSVDNTIPDGPPAPDGRIQTGRVNDTTGKYITYPFEIEEAVEEDAPGGGGPPVREPTIQSAMTAEILPSTITVLPGAGVIGGDVLEFDLRLTNTSTDGIMTAYAFQAKFSESPALASRIGDKAFYGTMVAGAQDNKMTAVKKNGTSNGLYSGRWKGICINSSEDFLPEFNSGLHDESLECAGNRADADGDGLPELASPIRGIYPGDSQTVRIRIEAGTTDGALHVVNPGTLQGRVTSTSVVGPNGITYLVPSIDPAFPGNVLSIPDFGDNKVLRDADGTFNPTFAPKDSDGAGPDVGYDFAEQTYLTLPRENFAFTDILGRNHTCGTYGLHDLMGSYGIGGTSAACGTDPNASPVFGVNGVGDLVPGAQNLAALLHGFGEYKVLDDGSFIAPSVPYGELCVNPATPDGLRCGAKPFIPVAEFYKDNGDGTVTRQMISGTYGALGTPAEYLATFDWQEAEDVKEEIIPEPDPGGPCDPVEEPNNRKPSCSQLRTSATAHFHDLDVSLGSGINGGDQVEFTMDITNTSRNNAAWLTAFNYQTKQRSLADIGTLDGFSQDRRDLRQDSSLPSCNGNLDRGACWNAGLGIAHFPNVIGNGLLFGQMVWEGPTNSPDPVHRTDRTGQVIIPDFVAVDTDGIDPENFRLESVKKNGPFTPILKGNVNFICVKAGVFEADQDADAACAGVPAELEDGASGDPIFNPLDESKDNITRRLGLAPNQTQSVRLRHEFGDFRGALLELADGVITSDNIHVDFTGTGGLARQFDCEDQRELEFCHPELVGESIAYLPNTNATWLTPENLEDIKYVIINQPGDAARIMNFEATFGLVLRMAGFIPSAEFYAPDPNPDLTGTPFDGALIRQQVLGEYLVDTAGPTITSQAVTSAVTGDQYTYDVDATVYPGSVDFSLTTSPDGMTINQSTGMIRWTPGASGIYDVAVRATRGNASDTQSFRIRVATAMLDNFNRAGGKLGNNWGGASAGYGIAEQRVDVIRGGPLYWAPSSFGTSQEAAMTLTRIHTSGSHHGLLLKANRDHQRLDAVLVAYDAKRKRIEIIVLEHGASPRTVGTIAETLSDGDRLGAQALANGSVRVLVNGAQVGAASVGSAIGGRGGHIGVQYGNANNALFDNFGGGSITP